MTKHYVNKDDPTGGYYEIFTGELGSRWHWVETAEGVEYKDYGQWSQTPAAAYRDAANDWEANGNPSNRRLGGQLRAAATRSEGK